MPVYPDFRLGAAGKLDQHTMCSAPSEMCVARGGEFTAEEVQEISPNPQISEADFEAEDESLKSVASEKTA